jgi:predicted RND superfamily exporter protein
MKKLLILICFLFINFSCIKDEDVKFLDQPKIVDLNEYKGYQVIEKHNDFILGYIIILNKNNNVKKIKVYQITYEKYKVGDIIK